MVGKQDTPEGREELPVLETRAGEFEGEGGDGVEADVDEGLAGASDGLEPLLADAAGGHDEAFLVEEMLPADEREGDRATVLAWRRCGKLVSRRHG